MDDAAKTGPWSLVCENFDQLGRDARRYGLSDRWRTLVDGTRTGDVEESDWLEFLADMAEHREDEMDFATRSGYAAAVARASADGGYVCPAKVCGRYEHWSPLDEPPPCALFHLSLQVVP